MRPIFDVSFSSPRLNYYLKEGNRPMNINDAFPSNFIKASDLDSVPGKEMKLTISNVAMEDVGTPENPEQKPVVHFQGAKKGLVLNKTNALALETDFGPETDRWIGQQITLFTQPVLYQGRSVRGLRVKVDFQPQSQPGSALRNEPPSADLDDEIPF